VEGKSDDVVSIYEEWGWLLDKFLKYCMKILLGDLNAEVVHFRGPLSPCESK
jgi:hypothetical protein